MVEYLIMQSSMVMPSTTTKTEISTCKSSQLQNRGQYITNSRAGRSKMSFSDGSEYHGDFLGDEIYGSGTLNDKDGNVFM